jgi:RNA polymerase sigma-70 factor (ECF subfamily)
MNRDAFGQLVEQHQRRLYALTLMIVREPAGAEEVTQDAFVRAYTHLDQYDERRPFYPWVATIAVRLAQNWLRAHGRDMRREGTALEDAPEPSVAPGALDALLAGERNSQIWQAVAALSSAERTAVVLYYRDEMGVREIARAMGVTAGTIKTLLFRARRKLRLRLEAGAIRPEGTT